MSSATPEDLEKYHVRHVYNQIAPHFVGSTHKAWPKVEEFLLSLPAGSLIADVGECYKLLLKFSLKENREEEILNSRKLWLQGLKPLFETIIDFQQKISLCQNFDF